MNPSEASARQVAVCLRTEILPELAADISGWDLARVERIRGKLHALRCFSSAHGLTEGTLDGISAALESTAGLWELLEQNESTLVYLRQMEMIRALDLGANLAGQSELITAEGANVGEFAIGAIAVCLGWFTDTIWVELARMEQHVLSGSHVPRLQDLIWDFVARTQAASAPLSLAEARARNEQMAPLFELLRNPQAPAAGRTLLLLRLYVLLVALNLTVLDAVAPELSADARS